ncbi:MAG: TonB-dependent receptor [Chitinophagaceae bacterium]|jgi:outer membrane receptor protein involved in Fe transport|nr:TonB-dependent receptor [Chitinophagaceae bacterium]
MNKILSCFLSIVMLALTISKGFAQETSISGTVRSSETKEPLQSVSILIKGTSVGDYTNQDGRFHFTTTQKLPVTLVISSVGFANKEVVYNGTPVEVSLDISYALGTEVVVAASRTPEKILESPVTIEHVSSGAILKSPAANYYDVIGNLKGVDVTTSSMTFKSISTRGFNGSGNLRLNQIVDGMDNQAPGLNFSVGNIIGLTALDVDNMELLAGASSALYGPGGMNGTLLINPKSPFKYQGLSFEIKQGINHIADDDRGASGMIDYSVRWADKVSNRFAYKIGVEYMYGQDWLGENKSNYLPGVGGNRLTGQSIPGTRASDPNYDGVNVYGDETTSPLTAVGDGVRGQIGATAAGAGALATIDGYLAANPTLSLSDFTSLVNTNPAFAGLKPLLQYMPLIYGSSSARDYFNGQNVSRTGYNERDVISPITRNIKLSGGLYYKITDKIEASLTAYYGTGNTVYTGTDRYSLKDLKMGQYKIELRAPDWFIRAYTTQEDAGHSYNATIAARYFNEAWSPSATEWYPTYATVYATAISAGASSADAHAAARATADQGRPTGYLLNNPMFQKVISTPISQGGALFVDKTALYNLEGQYNLTNLLNLAKSGTDILVGGNLKRYVLNSQGTIFADTAGKININETGAYLQVSQKLFNDILKLSFSGRYDKNTNFDGRFTPRASAVVKVAEDNHIRFSYQQAYRFPSTQNQWINLQVNAGQILMGGLPQLRDFYQFNSIPAYTAASFAAFAASGNPSVLTEQKFGKFKAETATSYELGYKGLINKKLLIDVYGYLASYNNFIGSTNVAQILSQAPFNYRIFSISTNSVGIVKTRGAGISLDYLLPNNFTLGGNLYYDALYKQPDDPAFITSFNSPKYRTNITVSNSGFGNGKRWGASAVYRWQDAFFYQNTFGAGNVSANGTIDAMVSYKFPKLKLLTKLGATNLLNHYYVNAFGNAYVGGLYYVSFAYNVF